MIDSNVLALAIAAGLALLGAGVAVGVKLLKLSGERRDLMVRLARAEWIGARVADSSPDGVMHFDAAGEPDLANRRWCTLVGRCPAGLGDERWFEAIAPADRGAARSLWARARATLEPCEGDFRLSARDPGRMAQLSFHPEVEGGRVRGFTARLRDISERCAAEAASSAADARYRLLSEHSRDLVVRLDPHGRAIDVSGAALRITGHAPAELIGRALGDLVHPDDAALFACLVDGNGRDETVRFRLRHRDGEYIWFEASQRPLFGADGAAIERIAVLRDISGDVSSTAALAEARGALELAVDAERRLLATLPPRVRTTSLRPARRSGLRLVASGASEPGQEVAQASPPGPINRNPPCAANLPPLRR